MEEKILEGIKQKKILIEYSDCVFGIIKVMNKWKK
jgi:hypothetical protein